MVWDDKTEVKKGNIGEAIIKIELENEGYVVYSAITDSPHKIDYFAHKGKSKDVIAVEIKTKKRMCTSDETGFDEYDYIHYKEVQKKHNMTVYIYFVDDFEECIYYQTLEKLGEGRLLKNNNIRVWELEKMDFIRELSDVELLKLRAYPSDDDKYDYSNTTQFFGKDVKIYRAEEQKQKDIKEKMLDLVRNLNK